MHRNVKFNTAVPVLSSDIAIHRTFMDTEGRTTLILTASNLVDDQRDIDLIVSVSPWQGESLSDPPVTIDIIRLPLSRHFPQAVSYGSRSLRHLRNRVLSRTTGYTHWQRYAIKYMAYNICCDQETGVHLTECQSLSGLVEQVNLFAWVTNSSSSLPAVPSLE